MKRYNDFNTEKRKNEKNKFDKSLFKLINNSACGKTTQNLRKRINVRLVNNAKKYLKYVSNPIFISQKYFSQHFAASYEIKPILLLNKPIYGGFTVLELSKYFLMYDFHYNFIKKKFDADLLFYWYSLSYKTKSEDVSGEFLNINTYLTY